MSAEQLDSKAAIEFLKRWAPNGPWVLTSIQTDRKGISTATFGPETEKECKAWLGDYNGKRNIYFHVNPPLKPLNKKAEREDIRSLDWLHVDIDPRAGEDLEQERKRALGLLTENLPKGVPAPTCIIFSGGGYQAFWRLEEPVPVNGDLEKAEDAKLYNLQLEVLFSADNCHNIDRIMRLPGTVNIPDAKKRRKDRTDTLAEVVEFNKNAYPISSFMKAPALQAPNQGGFGAGNTVRVPGNVERLADINELDEWDVPERVKIICVQGKDPEERKERDDSRSVWLFDAVCNLVRFEVPDATIFSIITDPGFRISESVLEMGKNAQKYAARQIEKAKEAAIDPQLVELNERHAVIGNMGGKCRIIEEVLDDALNRTRLTKQCFEDFRNRYMNRKVRVGIDKNSGQPIEKPLGKWWLEHAWRRQFDRIVFAPGREIPGAYNMWKGFAVTAKPGDCSLFLEHVRENICRGDPTNYEYLMGWLARAVQCPGTQGEVAVVLRGGRGTGKSFFAQHLGKLFGRHFLEVSNSSHLVGNFNAHLRDSVLLFADEAFYAGDRKHESILKTLITSDTLTVEAKGVDMETARNFVHLVMASNNEHVVPAGLDERRFFVLDVGTERQKDTAYFRAIAEQLEHGGYEALLHHLLTHDISGFEVRNVPETEALQEQKELSLDPVEAAVFSLLEQADPPPGSRYDEQQRIVWVAVESLLNSNSVKADRATKKAASGLLRKLGGRRKRYRTEIGRVQDRFAGYWMPPLEICQQRWVKLFGVGMKWSETEWPGDDNENVDRQEEIPF